MCCSDRLNPPHLADIRGDAIFCPLLTKADIAKCIWPLAEYRVTAVQDRWVRVQFFGWDNPAAKMKQYQSQKNIWALPRGPRQLN